MYSRNILSIFSKSSLCKSPILKIKQSQLKYNDLEILAVDAILKEASLQYNKGRFIIFELSSSKGNSTNHT